MDTRTPSYDENATCEHCGRFGAYRFDGQTLCEQCYAEAGSCCLEFGGDDLWRTEGFSTGHASRSPEENR